MKLASTWVKVPPVELDCSRRNMNSTASPRGEVIERPAKLLGEITFEELRRCAVCVAVHPTHSLARARKVSLEQVANERLIGFAFADYPEYHLSFANLFAPLKRVPQIAEEHDSSTSLIAAVEAGRGVALVLQGFDCFSGPRLKVRPISPAPPPAVIGTAYHKNTISAATENFIVAARRAKSA